MPETINRIKKYFSLSVVGVNPKTVKLPFVKNQIKRQEIKIIPMSCNMSQY